MFGTYSFVSDGKPKSSSFLIRTVDDSHGNQLLVAKVLLLWCVEDMDNCIRRKEDLAYLKYIDCMDPIYNVEKLLNHVCLRWSTSHTLTTLRGAQKESVQSKNLMNAFPLNLSALWRGSLVLYE